MNYVLFFPDELRAKTLSCYGHPTIQTPSFDRLSLEGVTFESCYVQNPVCSPSRCCLFTGAYVHTLGHRTLWNLLKPHEHNMLETFKQAGYQVRVYGKNDLFSAEAAAASTDVFENRTAARAGQAENTAGYGQKGYYDFVYRRLGQRTGRHRLYPIVESRRSALCAFFAAAFSPLPLYGAGALL